MHLIIIVGHLFERVSLGEPLLVEAGLKVFNTSRFAAQTLTLTHSVDASAAGFAFEMVCIPHLHRNLLKFLSPRILDDDESDESELHHIY